MFVFLCVYAHANMTGALICLLLILRLCRGENQPKPFDSQSETLGDTKFSNF